MIGGKFYEADAHGIRILLSKWLSKDEMWALMKGRLELLKLEDFDTVRELADGLIGLLEGMKK